MKKRSKKKTSAFFLADIDTPGIDFVVSAACVAALIDAGKCSLRGSYSGYPFCLSACVTVQSELSGVVPARMSVEPFAYL